MAAERERIKGMCARHLRSKRCSRRTGSGAGGCSEQGKLAGQRLRPITEGIHDTRTVYTLLNDFHIPLAVITPACGGSGSEPTPVSVAGGWVGTVQDNIVGAENRWTPILLHRTSVIQVYGDDREVSSSATCISQRTNLNRFLVDAPTRTNARREARKRSRSLPSM
jgi:hypothetical protein